MLTTMAAKVELFDILGPVTAFPNIYFSTAEIPWTFQWKVTPPTQKPLIALTNKKTRQNVE